MNDMIDTKFQTREDYLNWCSIIVKRINMGRIAMNDSAVQDALDEIDSKLHLAEGQELYL